MITIKPAPAVANKPSGKLYLGTNQLNLVNNVITLVELDTIAAGFTDGIEDTTLHRITPGFAGFYSLIGKVIFTNVVLDRLYSATIRLNGVTLFDFSDNWVMGGIYPSVLLVSLVKLTATDYIELCARSVSGDNTVDIIASEAYTFLSVQRVR